MIDFKNMNEDTIKNLEKRGYILPTNYFELKNEFKNIKIKIETIQNKMNKNLHVPEDKVLLKELKNEENIIMNKINEIIYLTPNILHHTVPNGKNAEDNPVIKEELFNIELKNLPKIDHAIKGKDLGMNTELGVNLAHARFTVMRGKVAKVHRKLINMALDHYGSKGYEEFYLPNLLNKDTMFGTGQYPNFKEQLFTTQGNDELFLIPTGEVPLTNIVANKIWPKNELEQKLMTHTPCFRKEAGTYGKDTKGILRQHQFEKVELVRTCLPENGLHNFYEMVADIEVFIKQFHIPYRIIELCAGDIGFAGHKAYDFEMWFPGEAKFREIATITWCHDFQARRMNFKYKDNGKNLLGHTLNGTGLAVGRLLAALIENDRLEDFV